MDRVGEIRLVVDPLRAAMFGPPLPLPTELLRQPTGTPRLELFHHVVWVAGGRDHDMNVVGADVEGVQHPPTDRGVGADGRLDQLPLLVGQGHRSVGQADPHPGFEFRVAFTNARLTGLHPPAGVTRKPSAVGCPGGVVGERREHGRSPERTDVSEDNTHSNRVPAPAYKLDAPGYKPEAPGYKPEAPARAHCPPSLALRASHPSLPARRDVL